MKLKADDVAISVFRNDDGELLGQFLLTDGSKLTGQGIEFAPMEVIGLANFSQSRTEEQDYEVMEFFVGKLLRRKSWRAIGARGNPISLLKEMNSGASELSYFKAQSDHSRAAEFVIRNEYFSQNGARIQGVNPHLVNLEEIAAEKVALDAYRLVAIIGDEGGDR